MVENQANKSLTQTQKTGFVLLLVFAVLTIGLGGLQLRNTIYSPFVVKMSEQNLPLNILSDEQARLQSIDTDHDGLNDWEELNFYGTSPYLTDTDSDGLNDKTEIDQGTNPLCAEGEVCDISTSGATDKNEPITSPVVGNVLTANTVLEEAGLGAFTGGGEDLNALMTAIKDPAKLREILLQSGSITAEELSKIDDATLLKTANELIQGQSPATSNLNNISTSTTNNTTTLQ